MIQLSPLGGARRYSYFIRPMSGLLRRYLVRMVSMILLPGLLLDPSFASAVQNYTCSRSPHLNTVAFAITIQAVNAPIIVAPLRAKKVFEASNVRVFGF